MGLLGTNVILKATPEPASGVAGAAGVSPAAPLSLTLLNVAGRIYLKTSPSIYRKESRRVGEADPPMRGNHPGSLSFLMRILALVADLGSL